ncbi:hypothetical protein [Bacillus mesophilum]|uniref:Uncharacterized protein n=1 Tax=Bacillus mesophilum TaxID=1071718 RepID=A0A7V7RJ84_9BACI|nr:hypothetical protein [Bacillus mesophilum]KAB2329439.1 hypothetical protein F7732_21175 [Bacillus mesophilum]
MNLLKNEKLRNIMLIVLFIILTIVFYALNNISFDKDQQQQQESATAAKDADEEEFEGIEGETEYIKPEELDDYVMKAFLQELVGKDYTLLINLFELEMLDKDIGPMSEEEFIKYAKEAGEKIKINKELVIARVLTVEVLDDGATEYQIELEFRDGMKKFISLKTKDGKIITPIESMY